MRVMTFNLRFDNEQDGENAWPKRRERVIQLIKHHAPSILGTQEGMWSQLSYLRDHLHDYHLHVPDRIIDNTCQYPTLFFHKDDIVVQDGGEFWLSKTPEVHRSISWDSAFPRMMSHARVKCTKTNSVFQVVVTHLDHIGEDARYQQANMIAQWVKEQTDPVILMGDFNDSPGSRIHNLLTSPQTGLFDTWQSLGREEDAKSFTHHNFSGVPQKTRMDWILASPNFDVSDVIIIKDSFKNRYPSDHFPYMAELNMKF